MSSNLIWLSGLLGMVSISLGILAFVWKAVSYLSTIELRITHKIHEAESKLIQKDIQLESLNSHVKISLDGIYRNLEIIKNEYSQDIKTIEKRLADIEKFMYSHGFKPRDYE